MPTPMRSPSRPSPGAPVSAAAAPHLEGDFTESGTLETRYGTRVVVLPEELVVGLHQAIEYETGRAWKLVAYTCGRKWGERLLRMMQREWRDHSHHQLEHLEYHIFEAWLTQYFRSTAGAARGRLLAGGPGDGAVLPARLDARSAALEEFDDDYVNEIFAGVLGATSSWLARPGARLHRDHLDAIGRPAQPLDRGACRAIVAEARSAARLGLRSREMLEALS